jgi:hypothetical protein
MKLIKKWEEVPWWLALAFEGIILIWVIYWGIVLSPAGLFAGYGT